MKACIFDLDGTIANTLASLAYFGNTALIENGYEPTDREKYRYFIGDGADMLIRRMLQDVAGEYSEEDVKRVRKSYDALYEATPLFLTEVYEGIPETIEKLKKMGIRCAVLSNKPHNMTEYVIGSFFPEGTFDEVLGQQEGIEKKPSPQGALLIAEKLGVAPGETLYVGDTAVDMKTGNSAGMVTLGALWGFRDKKELEENGAQYLLKKPEQIAKTAEMLLKKGTQA